MNRHVVGVILIWIVLTAVGELLAIAPLYPTVGAPSAEEFDSIFRILIIIGMPVFTFVVAVLAYAMYKFGGSRLPEADGPHIIGSGMVPKVWMVATSALAIGVMIYPGLVSLAHLQTSSGDSGWGEQGADLHVQVTAHQFFWEVAYVEHGVTVKLLQDKELVLPIDTTVRFDITSGDVLHSYWIPAFRMKIDAMPGRITYWTVTPDKLGSYYTDDAYRIQCAELCGVDHTEMKAPVRVVEQAEFDQWLAEQKKAAGGQVRDASN